MLLLRALEDFSEFIMLSHFLIKTLGIVFLRMNLYLSSLFSELLLCRTICIADLF